MKHLLLLGCALTLGAQNALFLDLRGDWRQSPDDQPGYAATDFDDRAWAVVRLPWEQRPKTGAYWLRRSVHLPQGAGKTQLALTLGPVSSIHEVYVNGLLIGRAGSSFDDVAGRPAFSRVHPIPSEAAGTGSRLTVAIRTRGLGAMRGGPYQITSLELASVNHDFDTLGPRRLVMAPQLILAGIQFVFSLLLGLLWLTARASMEPLWLSVLVGIRARYEWANYHWANYHVLDPDARPPLNHWSTGFGEVALLELCFASVSLRAGWLRPIIWALGLGLGFMHENESRLGQRALDCAAIAVLVFGWWKNGGARQPRLRHLMAGTLVLLAAARINSSGLAVFPFYVPMAGYQWSVQSLTTILFAATLTILLVVSLGADRREKDRLAAELESARTVQQLMMTAPAAAAEWETAAEYHPALQVGGDFYWTRVEDDGALTVAVGDVSGKGLRAAMLASLASGVLGHARGLGPAVLLGALNRELAGRMGGGFVTCCCARFGSGGEVTIANAGHVPPYADGREAEVSGLPLGVMADAEYAEAAVSGERFTFVSDGVVEAENIQRELFGFERTREISGKSAREIAEAAKAWGQNDDITVVTVQRTK